MSASGIFSNQEKRERANVSEQNCDNCGFFLVNTDLQVKKGLPRQGWCRAHPPTLVMGVQQQMTLQGMQMVPVAQGQFPPTAANVWCGDWQSVGARNARVIEHEQSTRAAPTPAQNRDGTDEAADAADSRPAA